MTSEREDAAIHKAWCNSLWARVPTYNWILECDCGATEHKPAAPEPAPERWLVMQDGYTVRERDTNNTFEVVTADVTRSELTQRLIDLLNGKQHSQPCPVTVEELRKRAQLIRTGWTFYEAPQIAAELDELADWLGGQR